MKSKRKAKSKDILKIRYGFPIVSSRNIFKVLRRLNLTTWTKIGKPILLEDYLKRKLTSAERNELRFAPKIEVAKFKNSENEIFSSFRIAENNGTVIFAVLPGDLIPIAAEFRHGTETISLNLPGGMIEADEKPDVAAKREFEEETGIVLKKLISLSPLPAPINARRITLRNFQFLGIFKKPIVIKKQRLETEEKLKILLIPIKEWLKLIYQGRTQDNYSIVTTFLALKALKRENNHS